MEVGLRINGFSPNKLNFIHKNEPTFLEYDSILGWKNKIGVYKFPGYDTFSSDTIKLSFTKDGLRKTSYEKQSILDSRQKLLFMGGSFTQGQAISDSSTMTWKVQKIFPEFEVLNAGTSAYGTYQSLLFMEQLLPQLENTKVVFYGMIEHHLERNIAPANWVDLLLSAAKRKEVFVPYVSIHEDQLIRNLPISYQRISFASQSAVIKFLERKLVNYKSRVSVDEKYAILTKLLLEMNSLSKEHGAKFVVIGLNLKDTSLDVLKEHKFTFIDCQWDSENPAFTVKNEGHPNEKANDIWVSYIQEYLKRAFLSNNIEE